MLALATRATSRRDDRNTACALQAGHGASPSGPAHFFRKCRSRASFVGQRSARSRLILQVARTMSFVAHSAATGATAVEPTPEPSPIARGRVVMTADEQKSASAVSEETSPGPFGAGIFDCFSPSRRAVDAKDSGVGSIAVARFRIQERVLPLTVLHCQTQSPRAVRSLIDCGSSAKVGGMPTVTHPRVSWIACDNPAAGVFRCVCQACGAAMQTPGGAEAADRFASVHAQHEPARPPSHYGLGDLVARATGAVGIKPCAPCKQRQAQLNGVLPRVLRRR